MIIYVKFRVNMLFIQNKVSKTNSRITHQHINVTIISRYDKLVVYILEVVRGIIGVDSYSNTTY